MSEPDDVAGEDGRQFERTALAHWRTTLAAVAVGLLIVRQSSAGGERTVAVVGVLAALSTIVVVGYTRRGELHRADAKIRPVAIIGIVAAMAVLELVAVVVVL